MKAYEVRKTKYEVKGVTKFFWRGTFINSAEGPSETSWRANAVSPRYLISPSVVVAELTIRLCGLYPKRVCSSLVKG